MTGYDYKVIPAPTKGQKAQGIKTAEGRFANTVEGVLNTQAAEGWEYLRSDILPSEERHGLTGSQTVYRTLLVFRRAKGGEDTAADEVIANAQTVAEAADPAPTDKPEGQPANITPDRGDPATPPRPADPDAPQEPDTPDTPRRE